MYNSGLFKFRKISSPTNPNLGNLTPIEIPGDIPFEVKRMYYIYGVGQSEVRGNHSHKKLHLAMQSEFPPLKYFLILLPLGMIV